MSQQNDQNRDREQQGEGYQDVNEQSTRETRGDSQPSEQGQGQQKQPGSNQDLGSDLDDADDLDEDRDDDLRSNGGANRRNNIG